MTDKSIELINKKIRELQREYQNKGYNVVLQPTSNGLPEFLNKYQPDIIARNNKENVVIEVKSSINLTKSKYLQEIAELVNNQPGWRFELVITNPKNSYTNDINEQDSLEIEEIRVMLLEAKKLLELNYFYASYTQAWILLESIIRKTLINGEVKNRNKINVLLSIKNLYAYGYISKEEYDYLSEELKIRNKLIHGFKVPELNKNVIQRFISFASDLFEQNLNL